METPATLAPGRVRRAAFRGFVDTLALFARRKPLGAASSVIVAFLIAVAILAPLIAPYDPIQVSGATMFSPPSPQHLMGTDEQGRDVFSRVVWGARVSLYVATLSVAIAAAVASIVGITSGFLGGKVDAVTQRFVDAIMAFPLIVLMLTLMVLFGNSLPNLVLGIGLVYGVRNSRVIRSEVLALKERQFVDAARAIGCGDWRIMVVHILPNTFAPIMVIATLTWGNAILVESMLSFLGFGVPPPDPSWGRMVAGAGRMYLEAAPWIAFFPGLGISLTVFGFNMLGDALRDVLDPRMRMR